MAYFASRSVSIHFSGNDVFGAPDAGKVYFVAGQYDVKLQADEPVRWDVVLRD